MKTSVFKRKQKWPQNLRDSEWIGNNMDVEADWLTDVKLISFDSKSADWKMDTLSVCKQYDHGLGAKQEKPINSSQNIKVVSFHFWSSGCNIHWKWWNCNPDFPETFIFLSDTNALRWPDFHLKHSPKVFQDTAVFLRYRKKWRGLYFPWDLCSETEHLFKRQWYVRMLKENENNTRDI